VWAVAFSPDGSQLVSASLDKTATLWNVGGGDELFALRGRSRRLGTLFDSLQNLSLVAFSPNSERLATARWDGEIRIWSLRRGREMIKLMSEKAPLSPAAMGFTPDGRHLVVATGDGAVVEWNVETGESLARLSTQRFGLRGSLQVLMEGTSPFALSRDRELLASTDDDLKVTEKESDQLDGAKVDIFNYTYTAKIWDVTHSQELHTLKGHSRWVNAVAFSADSRRLATGSADNTARIWDVSSGRELLKLDDHSSAVLCVAFSPDGKRLATASKDKKARVYDSTTGRLLLMLQGHSAPINAVAFSADGMRLATGSDDGTAKVWDALDGQPILTFPSRAGRVTSVDFSRDGKHFAISSGDGTVQVFTLDLPELLRLSRMRVTRDLTPNECNQYFQSEKCPPLP
jgi:WD40 repeat protein